MNVGVYIYADSEELEWAGLPGGDASSVCRRRAREVRRYIQYDLEPPV